jgi:hypothetical protein
MTDPEKEKYLDELLDSALSAYSEVEPRSGLETRILARVREAGSPVVQGPRSWRWWWTGAAAAVAVLLGVFLFVRYSVIQPAMDHVGQNTQPAPEVTPRTPDTAPVISAKNPSPRRGKRIPRQAETVALNPEPRQTLFPTPTPLSEQEKLLLSYYARTPREELIAQSHPEEPPVSGAGEEDIAIPNLISVPQKSSNTR